MGMDAGLSYTPGGLALAVVLGFEGMGEKVRKELVKTGNLPKPLASLQGNTPG